MQLVAKVPQDDSPAGGTCWLSASGGDSYGFLVRGHDGEDTAAEWDHWCEALADVLAMGKAFDVSESDWHPPARTWDHAPPPAGFEEREYFELGRRLLGGELTAVEAGVLAVALVGKIAQEIATHQVAPLLGAHRIFDYAWQARAWDDTDPCPTLKHWGAEFIQLADALERHQDVEAERAVWEGLVVEAAQAVVDARDLPEWHDDGGPLPVRP